MSSTMTIRLEAEDKARLDELATATQRSKSFLAAQAIREYLDTNAWQVAEIENALVEADNDDFATTEEVTGVINKWTESAR